MVALSSKSDYALVLLGYLAKFGSSKPVPLRLIASSQRLPLKYLAGIATKLTKAGLIGTKEGAAGGVYLTKDPAQIKISEVILALEGKPALTRCTHLPGSCQSESVCHLKPAWFAIQKDLVNILASRTLADLI